MIKSFHCRCTLNIAFSYTAREEICSAVKKLSKAVDDGCMMAEDIDEAAIEKSLYTGGSPRPAPDLLVRTSGEVRLSDFLLWQSSYSVTYFSEVLWPDFSLYNLMAAIFYFQRHHSYVTSLRPPPLKSYHSAATTKDQYNEETRLHSKE